MNKRSAAGRRARARGFTMIEVLAALAITALMVAGVTTMMKSSLDDTRAQQAALYQQQLSTAARQLIQQNYAALAAVASTTTPVVVTFRGAPYQLSTYLSSSTKNANPYGQTPCLLVYADAAGGLNGLLVTEGGTTIADPELGYIAANAGQGGGSIPATNNAAGAAMGAFGGWSVATPNPAGASCSGTKTGKGHLASQVFDNGNQTQNADYLYRVAVPGNPGANTMQVPVVLAQQQDYQACASTGAIAADALGNVLNCEGGIWEPQASFHWRGTVANEAALTAAALPNAVAGDVAVTLATNRAYTYNGTTGVWQALAVNEAGNLDLGNTQTIGNPCTPSSSTTTPITTDSMGHVLSCQNGFWLSQMGITPGSTVSGCMRIMESSGAFDYSYCSGPPSGPGRSFPYQWNPVNGFWYQLSIPVSLTKPGGITATGWAHMNDGSCSGKVGAQAQFSQSIYIEDSTNTVLAHTESMSPTLTDDSGGINNNIMLTVPAGNYTVVVQINWEIYANLTMPYISSFCEQPGNVAIPITPIAEGWTVNSFY